MIGVKGLGHWSLPVTRLEESVDFYKDFLGLELRGSLGRRATCFRAGESDFIIWETGSPVSQDVRDAGVHYSFNMAPEIWNEAIVAIDERGIELAGPIIYRKSGTFPGREVYMYDPSGNKIELTDPSWIPGMPEPTYEQILKEARTKG